MQEGTCYRFLCTWKQDKKSTNLLEQQGNNTQEQPSRNGQQKTTIKQPQRKESWSKMGAGRKAAANKGKLKSKIKESAKRRQKAS